uniref:Uncharacterized protein n=1 Tax=Arundo donax TaxID=35708 RepID=A0A0A9GMQ6_ARUDO
MLGKKNPSGEHLWLLARCVTHSPGKQTLYRSSVIVYRSPPAGKISESICWWMCT